VVRTKISCASDFQTLVKRKSKWLPPTTGPEFVSRMLDQWAYRNGVTLDFSRPGKPTDNAYVESRILLGGGLRRRMRNRSFRTERRRSCKLGKVWAEIQRDEHVLPRVRPSDDLRSRA
jgi:transposase InsO family protein